MALAYPEPGERSLEIVGAWTCKHFKTLGTPSKPVSTAMGFVIVPTAGLFVPLQHSFGGAISGAASECSSTREHGMGTSAVLAMAIARRGDSCGYV